jgi:hypothetical protein
LVSAEVDMAKDVKFAGLGIRVEGAVYVCRPGGQKSSVGGASLTETRAASKASHLRPGHHLCHDKVARPSRIGV